MTAPGTTDPSPQQPAATADPAAPPAPDSSAPNPDNEPLGEAGMKALQAEREQRKTLEKQLADAAAKVKAFEDEKLTEAEKLTKARTEAEQQAADAQRELARYKVIAELGVPAELQEFVTGADEATIRASAGKLVAAFAASRQPGIPKPDPSQGANPHGTPTLTEQASDALAKGDVKASIAFKAAQLTNPK